MRRPANTFRKTAVSGNSYPLKLTIELANVLRKAAKHCEITPTEMVRCTAVGIRNERPVIQRDFSECITKCGEVIFPVREFNLPDGIEQKDFRRLLYLRCMEELDKPKRPIPNFAERPGTDYLIDQDFKNTD